MAKRKFDKKEKQVLIFFIILAVLIIGVIVFIKFGGDIFKQEDKGKEQNTEVKDESEVDVYYKRISINEEKRFDIYIFSSSKFTIKDGETKFSAIVRLSEENKETTESKLVVIRLLDKNKEIIRDLNLVIPTIIPGRSVKINTGINMELENVDDYEIIFN